MRRPPWRLIKGAWNIAIALHNGVWNDLGLDFWKACLPASCRRYYPKALTHVYSHALYVICFVHVYTQDRNTGSPDKAPKHIHPDLHPFRLMSQIQLELLPCLPRYVPTKFTHAPKLAISKLHCAELDHPRIQPQGRPHILLCLARGIVTHDEVMTLMVGGLMLARTLGKGEDAPVLDASNGPAVAQDERARSFGKFFHFQ